MATGDEHFNEDELAAPEWLNVELLNTVLRQHENDANIQVKSVNFTPASAKGDHYASIMFRAAVEYEQRGQQHATQLIIKTMPELEGAKKDMLKETFIFETEIGMYTEILPKFESLLRAAGDETVLAAKCIYHSLKPHKFIVFEDLVPLGYTVVRERSFTLDEIKLAYLKIAKIHAISYKLCAEQPKVFDAYTHSVMATADFVKNSFVQDGISCFVEFLNDSAELSQYKQYFEPLLADLVDKVVSSAKEHSDNYQEGVPYVLCHGDFHGKNMMVKMDEVTKKGVDVMLLDYQVCYVGSIANDLLYSFYMLLDGNQRANHLEQLLAYYFDTFVSTLKLIGYSGRLPTIEDLHKELFRQRHYELFLLVSFLPLWLAVHDKTADIDQAMTSTEYRKRFYTAPKYAAELKTLLPKFVKLGYFK